MKKLSTMLAAALVLAVALTASGAALAESATDAAQGGGNPGQGYGHFSDVDAGHWAFHDVAVMQAKGVFGGYGDGRFGPQDPVTRIQLVCLALRIIGVEDDAEEVGSVTAQVALRAVFGDASTFPAWRGAQECLAYAYEHGYLFGLTHEDRNRFRPNEPASRLEVIVTLLEAMGLREEAQARMGAAIDAPDAADAPGWARGYVALAIERGLLRGDEKGNLNLTKPVRRCEMAALLARVDGVVDTPADDTVIKGTIVSVTTGDTPSITIATTLGELNRYRDRERKQAAEGDLGGDGSVPDADEQATETQAGDDETSVTETYPVSPDAQIFLDGKEATSADLAVGDRVEIVLADGVVVFIDARSEDEPGAADGEDVQGEVKGTLVAVTETTLTLEVTDVLSEGSNLGDDVAVGAETTLSLAGSVEILAGTQELTLSDLTAGMTISVTLEDGLVTRIRVENEGAAGSEAGGTGH